MNYKKYNDYELIYSVRENDEQSYDCLFNKYVPLMKKMAYKYYSNYRDYGYELEDFQQEAYISFCSAIHSYNDEKNSLFYTFVTLCINRALMTFCRKISCEKKNLNNSYFINLDDSQLIYEDSNIEKYLEEVNNNEFIKHLYLNLDFDDSCVMELRYNGFAYKEISILLDIPLRKVQFIGRKLKKIVNSRNK